MTVPTAIATSDLFIWVPLPPAFPATLPAGLHRCTIGLLFVSSLGRLQFAGVYQIGEAQARSWTVSGTSGGIFTPKRTAS